MKRLIMTALIALYCLPAMALTQTKYSTFDLSKDIEKTSIRAQEAGWWNWQITYSNGTSAADFTGADQVYFNFSSLDYTSFNFTITGSVVNASEGIINIPFTALTTATNGTFLWNISVGSNGQEIVKHPWGNFWLVRDIFSTNTMPLGTNVDLSTYTFINYPWVGGSIGIARGDLTYYDGTNWVRLAAGMPGEYLKTDGSATAPSWDAPAGGGDMLKSEYDTDNSGVVDDSDAMAGTNSALWALKTDAATAVQAEGDLSTISNTVADHVYQLRDANGEVMFGMNEVLGDYGNPSLGKLAYASGDSVSMGWGATAVVVSVSIGSLASATNNSVAISGGCGVAENNSVYIGGPGYAKTNSVGVGYYARAEGTAVAIGYFAEANGIDNVAIGSSATVNDGNVGLTNTLQFGKGNNTNENSVYLYDNHLMDSDGTLHGRTAILSGTNAAGVSLTATGAVDAGDVISGAAGTTNAITSGGLVDISSLLGGGGFATNYAGANVQIAWTGNVSYISADAETDPIWGGVSNLYLQNIVEDTTPQLGGNLSGGGYSITNVGYASITGTNAAGVSLTTVGNVGIGTNSPANPLHVSSINSIPLKIENTTVGGAVGMYYTTDDYSWQTKVGVPGDFLIQNITGSAVPLQMTRETLGGAIYGSSAGITINNNGSDIDFKVEGTGDTDLIHTDAANDRVGIGTASPTTTLDVAGSATVREKIYLSALDTDSWITATTNAAGIVTDYTFRVNGTNKLWSSF